MLKIKKNDKVIINCGVNKGKVGLVKKIIRNAKKKYVLLDGVDFTKKHIKSNPSKNKPGGIINISTPISLSNIMLINPKTNKKDKIFFNYIDGKKYRVFKTNKEFLN